MVAGSKKKWMGYGNGQAILKVATKIVTRYKGHVLHNDK